MLSRLFKYDNMYLFKRIKFYMLFAAIIGILAGLIFPLTIYITNKTLSVYSTLVASTLSAMLGVMLIGFFVVLPIIAFVNICNYYADSAFSDQGYLTFTLPAKTSQIMFSKWLSTMLWGFIYVLFTLIIAAVSGLLAWFLSSLIADVPELSALIQDLLEMVKSVIPNISVLNVLVVLAFLLFLPTAVVFSTTFACLIPKKRGLSIVVLLVLSQILSTIQGIILIVIGFITDNMSTIDIDELTTANQIISLVVYAAVGVVLYLLSAKMLKNKLSLN